MSAFREFMAMSDRDSDGLTGIAGFLDPDPAQMPIRQAGDYHKNCSN
jgi:hypothetical protein